MNNRLRLTRDPNVQTIDRPEELDAEYILQITSDVVTPPARLDIPRFDSDNLAYTIPDRSEYRACKIHGL